MATTGPSSKVSPNGAAADSGFETMDFALPDFLRWVWVHDAARLNWQPRIDKIARAWREIEWLSVVEHVRQCVLCTIPAERWNDLQRRSAKAGLSIEPLMVKRNASAVPGRSAIAAEPSALSMRAVIGARRDAQRFARAWSNGDIAGVGSLLGYPECCCRFFVETMLHRDRQELLWAVASHSSKADADSHFLEIDGQGEANIFWRYLGVKAVPHIPCRFDCAGSLQLARLLADVGRRSGFAEEVEWTSQILRWPLEWSMLHGIAEMKTPILKVCTNAVASSSKYTIRWRGDLYPEDGAQGVTFPFRRPAFSTSDRFVEGLNIIYPGKQ